jgi:argininosuccinate lyase
MLSKQKIIKSEDANKIINGLKKIKSQIDNSNFEFKEKFEDIHLNIEKALFDIIGPSAGYMHTARSRNDQVVTDFKLWIKDASKEILKDISLVMKNLLKKAEKKYRHSDARINSFKKCTTNFICALSFILF